MRESANLVIEDIVAGKFSMFILEFTDLGLVMESPSFSYGDDMLVKILALPLITLDEDETIKESDMKQDYCAP